MRIAVIVKSAMRSDPDVHPLGMAELRVIRPGATEVTGLCLFKRSFSLLITAQALHVH